MPRPFLSSHRCVCLLSLALASCGLPAVPPQEASAEDPSHGPARRDLVEAEVSTVGWDRLSGSPVVLLRVVDSGQVVPIWVGTAEARAILAALQHLDFPRPMTHDLMANLLAGLDTELEEVIVHDLKDGVYYGWLKLRVHGEAEARLLDTRPSDGMALAVRTGAAIRLAEKLLTDLPDYSFMAPEEEAQVVRVAGLTVVAANPTLAQEFDLPERPGVVVLEVRGAEALRSLKRGDLLVEVNGRPLTEPMALLDAVGSTPRGEKLHLTLWRQGEEHEVELDPAAPPPPSRRKAQQVV